MENKFLKKIKTIEIKLGIRKCNLHLSPREQTTAQSHALLHRVHRKKARKQRFTLLPIQFHTCHPISGHILARRGLPVFMERLDLPI